MRTSIVVLAALALAACKSASSASPAPPAASSESAVPSAAPAPAPTAKAPTTKLTGQLLKETYASAMANADPFDKELAAVKAKLGDPQKVEKDTMLWWGWSPKDGALDATCWELSMSPTEGSSIGGTDWSKCGMAE